SARGRSRNRDGPCAPAPPAGREPAPQRAARRPPPCRQTNTTSSLRQEERGQAPAKRRWPCGRPSVDIVLRVVDVELAGRRDQMRILDHGLELARLVVHHDDGGLLVLRAPYREPH